jgi:hypothetical protein
LSALLGPLFDWSLWTESLWLRANREGRWSGLTSVPLFGLGSFTVVAGRSARALVSSRLCSFDRRVLIQCGVGPTASTLVWSCFCSFDRRGFSHCGGGLIYEGVGLVRSRLCSLGWRGLSLCVVGRLSKGVGLVSSLVLWSTWAPSMCLRGDSKSVVLDLSLLLWRAWAQLLWWRADRQGRWSGLVSLPLVEVGSVTVVAGR